MVNVVILCTDQQRDDRRIDVDRIARDRGLAADAKTQPPPSPTALASSTATGSHR